MSDDKRTTLDILWVILDELRMHRKLLATQGDGIMAIAASVAKVDRVEEEVVDLRRRYGELAEVVTALVNNGLCENGSLPR
jgi:hypothetical protein